MSTCLDFSKQTAKSTSSICRLPYTRLRWTIFVQNARQSTLLLDVGALTKTESTIAIDLDSTHTPVRSQQHLIVASTNFYARANTGPNVIVIPQYQILLPYQSILTRARINLPFQNYVNLKTTEAAWQDRRDVAGKMKSDVAEGSDVHALSEMA